MTDFDLNLYQALLEVSEAISAHQDLPSLFRDLRQRLHAVVPYDGVIVLLYDEARDYMREYFLESELALTNGLPRELPAEGTPGGWVCHTQEPMFVTDATRETRFLEMNQRVAAIGVKSYCVLPLTAAGRRLGAIGFASRQPSVYQSENRDFLMLVARQVAVAVDNTLNFEAAREAQQRFARERDRLQLLLDINNAVVSALDLRALMDVISPCLRRIVGHDFGALLIYDPEHDQLRAHALDFPEGPMTEGVLFSMDGTPSGLAFRSRQTVLVNRQMLERFGTTPLIRLLRAEGVQSGCSLPLLSHDRALGVLTLMSLRDENFGEADAEFLTQIAGQIAIAVENSLNFERARTAEKELARKLEHLRLMLKVTTVVVSQLDLRELLLAISSSIREIMGADTSGVALFDDESQQLRAFATDFPAGHPLREEGFPIPLEGSPGGLAFTSGQPVFLDKPDVERFPSAFGRRIADEGYQSGGSIPLIAQGRKLGVMGVASKREAAFSEEDRALLIQVANQVAIAVDNALNFARARNAEQEAKRQSARLQLMLEINNAVVSELSLRELVRVTSTRLREALPHDVTGISLYDPENNQFRAYMFDLPDNLPPIEEGTPMSLEGTIGGLAFFSGRPVFLNRYDPEFLTSEFDKRLMDAGIRSGGVVPLIAHDKKLGFLGVGSFHENAFSEADQELLGHIANQIAIAVENALNFERAHAAEEQAKRQSDRRQLLLEINNAVVSQLDLRSLIQIISVSLRRISGHDVVGLALYDPDTNQLRAYAYDSLDKQFAIEEGTLIPLESSLSGSAFISGKPVFHDRIDEQRFQSDFSRRFRAAGLQSGGVVPLIAHGRKLGTLAVASYREANLNEDEKELLCQVASQVAIAVENALAFREIEALKNKLASEKHYLEDEIRTQHNFEELIGESQVFRRILRQVETVAPTGSTVLICGETGTGKELIARAIHDLSDRRERTLVKINCAAIPTGLLESELFGHEKGAFTGAISQRIGRFELAHRGSLFLDEVGDIPLELQPKLLRVLQEQEFERLGSTRTQKVDARLIAATNCDLEKMVADRKYRSDLYYRLNVFPITIPPLRERREDIPALTRFFTQRYARRLKKQITAIPSDVMTALTRYAWPGNVRELEHFIERAVILTRGSDLEVSLAELKSSEPVTTTELATLEVAERDHILRALEETNWVIGGPGGAAVRLGMKRTTLQSRMQKLGISR